MTKYFKVKIGFGADDFISIGQDELRKAMVAQVTGKIGIFNEGTVAGNSIISILPDYNREMGYNRDYKLTGEDYEHIGIDRACESRKILQETMAEVSGRTAVPQQIGEAAAQLADKFKI